MEVRTYSTHEELVEALRSEQATIMEGLSPQQQGIDLGSYWVRFVNLDAHPPIVEFGHVLGLGYYANLHDKEGGPTGPERAEVARDAMITSGVMFGWAHSLLGSEMGHTHKAYVWPVEERLFAEAAECGWNINGLGEAGRFLLELAFASHRAHVRVQEGKDPHVEVPSRESVVEALSPLYPSSTNAAIEDAADRIMALFS